MNRKTPAGQTAGVYQISSPDDITSTVRKIQAAIIDLSTKKARAFHTSRISYKKDRGWQNFHALRQAYLELAGEA